MFYKAHREHAQDTLQTLNASTPTCLPTKASATTINHFTWINVKIFLENTKNMPFVKTLKYDACGVVMSANGVTDILFPTLAHVL